VRRWSKLKNTISVQIYKIREWAIKYIGKGGVGGREPNEMWGGEPKEISQMHG
jgi:hypothetical protein